MLRPSVICTQEAGKKEEGKDVTSVLASGTRGNRSMIFRSLSLWLLSWTNSPHS